jgi:hypothetical protein
VTRLKNKIKKLKNKIKKREEFFFFFKKIKLFIYFYGLEMVELRLTIFDMTCEFDMKL